MDFKNMFAKELAAGQSVDEILRDIARSANKYEADVKAAEEARLRAEKEKRDAEDEYTIKKHKAAEHFVTELLDFINEYTDLEVSCSAEDIVNSFFDLLDSVKYLETW